jgi:hypothetical protein
MHSRPPTNVVLGPFAVLEVISSRVLEPIYMPPIWITLKHERSVVTTDDDVR